MSARFPAPGRTSVGLIAIALLAALLAWDTARFGLPDPFRFPPVFALGSGVTPSGAHCTAN
jgi:hypothetical protein